GYRTGATVFESPGGSSWDQPRGLLCAADGRDPCSRRARSWRTAGAGLQRPGARAAGRRSANRAGRGFLRRLCESRRRQPAREGVVRAVESPQDRSDLQVLRARAEICRLNGSALARPFAVNQGVTMIAIFDYGAGNLQSVQNTLAEIGATYTLTR